jgi:hypothetical protein
MPIAAGIVGDPRHAAVVAGLDVPTEHPGPAHRDCAHHTPFDATEMAGVVARKGLAVAAQYIGDLEDRPIRTKASADHGPRLGTASD